MTRQAGSGAIAAALAAALAFGNAGAAEPTPERLPGIEVVATVPLPGLATPLADVPANLQLFGAADIARSGASSVTDFLERAVTSVNVNAASGNPFQPDVNFRGFTASPLLGTPTGVSVFLDGVRVNELFGDTVNWDLVPVTAIASLQVMPGSSPVYGLNTLGGAFAMYTKNGLRFPGASAEISGGSWARRSATAELGGNRESLDGYVMAHAYDEDGWREHSSSRIRQAFGKGAWRGGGNEVETTFLVADNELHGTQALPLSMLDAPREAYTWPDVTTNRLAALSVYGRHSLAGDDNIAVNAYVRRLRSSGVNSNVNPDAAEDDAPQAFNVTSTIITRSAGASIQSATSHGIASMKHRLIAGVAYDGGSTGFTQASADAAFGADRETISTGPAATTVDATTRSDQLGIYAQDIVTLSERAAATLSVRYQRARIAISDNSGSAPRLDGTHEYQRLNAAAGATYRATQDTTVYASAGQGMRVPTAAELTCADPAAPCSLPNIFVADPPLQAVIATTFEAGARGQWQLAGETRATWSAAMFHTALAHDIQFIATGTGAINTGYFSNVGKTTRTGVELAASAPLGPFTLSARFSHVRAVFATDFSEHSPNNATADATGAIAVRNGDRIPGLPADLLKLRVSYAPRETLDIAATLVAASHQYARGNENNADPAGRVPGYAVLNLDATWRLAPNWEIEAQVTNLFDRRYETFGTLGSNFFRGPNDAFAPQLAQPEAFRGVGTARTAWIGVRYGWRG